MTEHVERWQTIARTMGVVELPDDPDAVLDLVRTLDLSEAVMAHEIHQEDDRA